MSETENLADDELRIWNRLLQTRKISKKDHELARLLVRAMLDEETYEKNLTTSLKIQDTSAVKIYGSLLQSIRTQISNLLSKLPG